MPSATLPRISCPRCVSAVAEKLAPGSTSGFVSVMTVAARTMTTTSESMTNASVKSAIGPFARVCDKMPSAADGLRVIASTPSSSAMPTRNGKPPVRANGTSGDAATKTSDIATRTTKH